MLQHELSRKSHNAICGAVFLFFVGELGVWGYERLRGCGPGRLTGYERLSGVIERLAGWYERLRKLIERMK